MELYNGQPIREGFGTLENVYVLPISVGEYWDNFYADDADYFYNKTLLEKGDEVHNWSDWYKPTEEKYMEWFGQEVLQQRDIEVAFDLPPNPFIKHATATKHYLLLNKTETSLDIAVLDNQNGFPYAESFETLEFWEIKAADPRSNQVAVRHSWMIDWKNRPWAFGSLIENTAHDKVQLAIDFFKGYTERNSIPIMGARDGLYEEADEATVEADEATVEAAEVVEALYEIRAQKEFDFLQGPSDVSAIAQQEEAVKFDMTNYIIGASVLSALALLLCLRRAPKNKKVLRDVDLPLHKNEINHYSLNME